MNHYCVKYLTKLSWNKVMKKCLLIHCPNLIETREWMGAKRFFKKHRKAVDRNGI